MGEPDLRERLALDGVPEPIVERDGGLSSVEHDADGASAPRFGFELGDEDAADAPALRVRGNRDLAHAGLPRAQEQREAADRARAVPGAEVKLGFFRGQLLGGEVETERTAQNGAAELDEGQIVGSAVRDPA
jgi:hypothetical protein